MKMRLTGYETTILSQHATTDTETETDFILYFKNDTRVVFDRFKSAFLKAGTEITISKKVHKGYTGRYLEATITK